MNLNQLSIIGFLGKDAEQKSLPNGTSVVKFSVATKRSWKDTNDEWQERTQWHQVVVIWNRTGFQARFSFEASFKEFMTAASDCSQ